MSDERKPWPSIGRTLLTSKEVAERLGMAESTLRQWRNQGKGPKYVKLQTNTKGKNGMIRYHLSDLENWEKDAFISGEDLS